MLTTLERNDRLMQLWKDLLADPVAPDPAARQGRTPGSRSRMNDEAALSLAPDRDRPPRLGPVLQEAEWMEQVPYTGTVKPELPSRGWMANLAAWFHSLVELEEAGPAGPSAEPAVSEEEALSDTFLEAADEETLSRPSPFRWEPEPAWITAPVRSNPPFTNKADPRQFAARPKIPSRPLHKQPFFMRIFFYLRRWLSRSS